MIHNYNTKGVSQEHKCEIPLVYFVLCSKVYSSIDEQCYICGEVLYLHLRNVKA